MEAAQKDYTAILPAKKFLRKNRDSMAPSIIQTTNGGFNFREAIRRLMGHGPARWASILGLCLAAGAAIAWAGPAQGESPDAAKALPGSIWISTDGAHYSNVPKVDQFIQEIRALPFSELIVQVRAGADAYYNSKLAPKPAGLPDQADPLAIMLKDWHAKPKPKRVIAWFSPYRAGNVNSAIPTPANHVLSAHPDWLSRRAGGEKTDPQGNMYLEPGLPEARQHMEDAVKELVRNYPIDGIYFDPMCDPDADWGYHPVVLAEWKARGGAGKPDPQDPAWIAFRAETITKALTGMVRAAREAKPSILVAVGALADGDAPSAEANFHQSAPYTQFHQDWARWARQKGLLDRLYLKDFRAEQTGAEAFNQWLKLALNLCQAQKIPVVAGVAGYLNESVDALAQLRRAAESGAAGVALADFEQPVRDSAMRSLFMETVGRTVLSPDYLATMAALAQGSLKVNAPETSATTTTSQTAPMAVSGAESTPTAKLKQVAAAMPAAKTSPAAKADAVPAQSGAKFELPPPPPMLEPDDAVAGQTRPPAAGSVQEAMVEEADGKLIPAQPRKEDSMTSRSREAAANEDELEMLKELAGLSEEKKVASAQSKATAQKTDQEPGKEPGKEPRRILTRTEVLSEIMNDPEFTKSRAWNLLRPDEQAREYLKKNFGNIF